MHPTKFRRVEPFDRTFANQNCARIAHVCNKIKILVWRVVVSWRSSEHENACLANWGEFQRCSDSAFGSLDFGSAISAHIVVTEQDISTGNIVIDYYHDWPKPGLNVGFQRERGCRQTVYGSNLGHKTYYTRAAAVVMLCFVLSQCVPV